MSTLVAKISCKAWLHECRALVMSKSIIRKILESRGVGVTAAAKMCGLPLSTVSAHYYGQRKTMTLPVAAKYAEGLGLRVDDLLQEAK